MDKTDWIFILAIVMLICVTILGVTGSISPEDVKDLFILVATALITGSWAYNYGKTKGFYKGKCGV